MNRINLWKKCSDWGRRWPIRIVLIVHWSRMMQDVFVNWNGIFLHLLIYLQSFWWSLVPIEEHWAYVCQCVRSTIIACLGCYQEFMFCYCIIVTSEHHGIRSFRNLEHHLPILDASLALLSWSQQWNTPHWSQWGKLVFAACVEMMFLVCFRW